MTSSIAVTGASGFIAQQLIVDLLETGYKVIGTVRTQAKADYLRQTLSQHTKYTNNLQLHLTDLEIDDGWVNAFKSADVIHHVASPVAVKAPKHPDELIRPARDGTLRVLRAATDAGVQRVVLTSSTAAIVYGHNHPDSYIYTEKDWSDVSDPKKCTAYPTSKTLAEQAAWHYVSKVDTNMNLTTINPAVVFGSIMSEKVKTSISIIYLTLFGKIPVLPNLGFPITDVKDVSQAHMSVMHNEQTFGERYIVGHDYHSLKEISDLLLEQYPEYSKRITKRQIPDYLVRILSPFNGELRLILAELGKKRPVSSEKVENFLGRTLTPAKESILASAESLLRLGVK